MSVHVKCLSVWRLSAINSPARPQVVLCKYGNGVMVMVLHCNALTGAAGLEVGGTGVAAVEQRNGTRCGEGVQPVGEGLVVKVVEGAVRLAGLEAGAEEHRPADEFILDGARSQTAALRFYLKGKEREKEKERIQSVSRSVEEKWATLLVSE